MKSPIVMGLLLCKEIRVGTAKGALACRYLPRDEIR